MQLLKSIRVFYKDRLNFWLVSVAGFSILATWFLFLFKNFVRSDLTVLHYNIYFGFDIVGNWWWLFIIPGISLLVSLLNFGLAFYLWTKQQSWSYFLLTINLVGNIMIFLFIFNIIDYNL